MTRDRLILAVLAGGFLTLAVETRFEHRDVVHENAAAWIPTITAVVALIATAYLLLSRSRNRWVTGPVFALVSLAGLVGLYFHTEFRPSAFAALLSVSAAKGEKQVESFEDFEDSAEKESKPPALAPLSLGGLGLIGLVLAFPPKRRDMAPADSAIV